VWDTESGGQLRWETKFSPLLEIEKGRRQQQQQNNNNNNKKLVNNRKTLLGKKVLLSCKEDSRAALTPSHWGKLTVAFDQSRFPQVS